MSTLNDSGPGPKTLVGGSYFFGYFGEVPASELITGQSLVTTTTVTEGSVSAQPTVWLKFIIDGRVVYIAKQPIVSAISWIHLKNKNLVDGSKILTIGSEQYSIRLMRGAPAMSITITGTNDDLEITHGSEWNKLIYRVVNKPGLSSEGIPFGEWAQFSDDALGIGNNPRQSTWCQESAINATTSAVHRGYGTVGNAGIALRTSVIAAMTWRPVLERSDILALNTTFRIENLAGDLLPPIVNVGDGSTLDFKLNIDLSQIGASASGFVYKNEVKIGEISSVGSVPAVVTWYAGFTPPITVRNGDTIRAAIEHPILLDQTVTIKRNQPKLGNVKSLAIVINRLRILSPPSLERNLIKNVFIEADRPTLAKTERNAENVRRLRAFFNND